MNSEDKDGMDLVHPAMSTSSVPDGVHSGDSGVSAPRVEGSAPRYVHDCDRCRFLGRYESDYRHEEPHVFDLYVCPAFVVGHTTVVARFSDSGADYYSGIEFAKPYTDLAGQRHEGIPMLVEARRRAIALDFLDAERSASGALPSDLSTVNPSRQESRPDDTQPAGSLPALQSKENKQ